MKGIIVEDEPLAMEELSYIITKHSRIEIVATFDDGLDALKYLQEHQIDVAFLDINVPSVDGMLLARNISQFARKPFIIFTTAHKDYAADAFEISAFDYILKPFNEARIESVLKRLEAAAAPAPAEAASPQKVTTGKINLTRDDRIFVTDVADICYAQADEKLTHVHTQADAFIMQMTLGEFMAKLPPDPFFRSHRSFCINLEKVQEIIPWYNYSYMVKLYGIDQKIPVSRSRVKEFRRLMNI